MSFMHSFARNSSSESSEDEDDFLHPSTNPQAEEFADHNPRKRRRTGRDAKESAALGVFGSESEDEGHTKRWKKKSLRGRGIGFVSTGQETFDEDEDEDEAAGDEDENTEDQEAKLEQSAGFRGGMKGLGFQSSVPKKGAHNLPRRNDTPLGKGFVPSSAAEPILNTPDDEETFTPRVARPSAFSTPNTNGKAKRGKEGPPINAGSFAARMMAKMGYKEGQGLGKEGTGRSGVIEVTLRPQGVGLGAVKEKSKQEIEEEKRQAKIRGEKYEDSDEERKKARKQRPKVRDFESQSASGASTPRRAPKPKYQTIEELQIAAPGLQIPEAFSLLDMTGPGQRLLTSTSGILTPNARTSVSETISETQIEQEENRKLARRAQNDLTSFVEEWKSLEERKAFVHLSITQLEQDIEEEQREYDQMKAFSDAVTSITQSVSELQWDPVIGLLKSLDSSQSPKRNEGLTNVAVAAVHPFLREAVNGWQPLEDPKLNGMAPQIFEIRHILGGTIESSLPQSNLKNEAGYRFHSKSTTAFESMIYKMIFPKIVSSINQAWDVRDPQALLTLLDTWQGLLPQFVRSQIIDQAVVNKLNSAVSSWNPRKRRTHELPHLWLFPWLQYLPSHHTDPKSSTGLVSDVKRKFRQLVDSWDFSKGVVPGLRQWKEVLRPEKKNDQWTPLIMNHVLPSMARFLNNEKNFMVDPNDQAPYMPALLGVLAWTDILSPRVVGQVIIETIFPMWHRVLHQWLTVVGPNAEIGEWFEWWRDAVFPQPIIELLQIQEEFEKGHDMINQALDLGTKAATHLPLPSKSIATPSNKKPPTDSPAKQHKPTTLPIEEVSFRHKVEDWCIENDLQFLPEKKVLHSAGPLYRVTAAGNGKNGTLVYFRGDSLRALQRKGQEQLEIGINWEDEDSKDALLEMAWSNVK